MAARCAVNGTVLAALARHKMRFCILAPTQAEAVGPVEGGAWQDVSGGNIDTTQPYRCYVSLYALVKRRIEEFDGAFSRVFEATRGTMEEMIREGLRVPGELQAAAERTLSLRLAEQVGRIRSRALSTTRIVESEMKAIVEQAHLFGLRVNTTRPSSHLGQVLLEIVADIVSRPDREKVAEASYLLDLAPRLSCRSI